MANVKCHLMMLYLHGDACILEIFQHLSTSIKHHPPSIVSYVKSILTYILKDTNDLLLKFIVFILYRAQHAITNVSYIAQNDIFDICAYRVQQAYLLVN